MKSEQKMLIKRDLLDRESNINSLPFYLFKASNWILISKEKVSRPILSLEVIQTKAF